MKNKQEKIIKSLLLITIGIFLSGIIAQAAIEEVTLNIFEKKSKNFVPGEILVKYKEGVSFSRRMKNLQSFGDSSINQLHDNKFMHIKLKDGIDVATAIKEYQKSSIVEYAQPNYIYYANSISPNDEQYDMLWGMKNTGQTIPDTSYSDSNPGKAGMDMNCEAAWDHVTDCSSVIVAVLDTGINYTHEDLAENMWDGSSKGYYNHGYDFAHNDDDPMDLDGHGTHVAGTIGAVGNNGKGVTGICWKVKLMAVRVLDGVGNIPYGTSDVIAKGINFAAENGAHVINMSLGNEHDVDPIVKEALTNAEEHDIVVVASAGNGGNDGIRDDIDDPDGGEDNDPNTKHYPCAYTNKNILCVAALDQNYFLSRFSNIGTTSVDVGAPGTNTRSSYFGDVVTHEENFNDGSGNLDWTIDGKDETVENNWGYLEYIHTDDSVYDMIVFPGNWYFSDNYYQADTWSWVYKNFGFLSESADGLSMHFHAIYDINRTGESSDFAALYYNDVDGRPYPGIPANYYGYTNHNSYQDIDLSKRCSHTSNCTVGFFFNSDESGVGNGMSIYNMEFEQKFITTNSFKTMNGTSMATPHAAGLAALLKAYNPDYTAADIIESIKEGGDRIFNLRNKINAGRAIDAYGSLKYIKAPENISISI